MLLERVARMPRSEEGGAANEGLRYFPPVDAESFRINYVEIAPGAHSHNHRHQWEQANYIVGGTGTLLLEDEVRHRVSAGDLILLEADELHQYINDGNETLQVLGVLGPEVMRPDA